MPGHPSPLVAPSSFHDQFTRPKKPHSALSKPVACVRDIRSYPWQSYVLPKDGRKARALAERRRMLAIQLATYADPDGTNIFPGANRLADDLGWSRRTLFERLKDLRELGLLCDKERLTSYHGTAIRSLAVHVLRMPSEEVQHPLGSSSIPRRQECHIEPVEVHNSREEGQCSAVGVRVIRRTRPSEQTAPGTDIEPASYNSHENLSREERERRDRLRDAGKRGLRNYETHPLEEWERPRTA